MPLRPRGLSAVPIVEDPAVGAYLQEMKEAIEGLPFSYFSTSDGPNESSITAPLGTLGIEIGSGITKFWYKRDETSLTSGWSYLSFIHP